MLPYYLYSDMITNFTHSAQKNENLMNHLSSLIVKHPAATVFMIVDSNRYTNIGIYCGDLITIDRAKKINENSLVVYESEDTFFLERISNIKKEAIITGVITHIIHTI